MTPSLLSYASLSWSYWQSPFVHALNKKELKYADNLTVFISDIKSVQYLFKLLDQFKNCSGLKGELYKNPSNVDRLLP